MRKYDFTVYGWEEAVSGGFFKAEDIAAYGAEGTALSIGGFDGVHAGHSALFNAVLARKDLLPGIITFAKPPRSLRYPGVFEGVVSTLAQRLDICREKGFAFAVVIDFSGEFGKMEGNTFLSVLADRFFMKFLAEGPDFRCGYKGAADIHMIRSFAEERNIRLSVIEPVIIGGERVSSTRIRAAVAAGDFACANRLIGRPFRLDCSSFRWEHPAPCCFSANTVTDGSEPVPQVLPPDGTYAVTVLCADGRESAKLPAVLYSAQRSIYIQVPETAAGAVITAVDFTA